MVLRPPQTISLSQLILLEGKRARGIEVAGLDRDLAAWDYETKRVDVFTRVAQAFVEVLRAQEGVALAKGPYDPRRMGGGSGLGPGAGRQGLPCGGDPGPGDSGLRKD